MFGPDDFAAGVHGHGGFLATQLDQDAAFVITQSDVVGAFLDGDAPTTLQTVVQRAF